MRSCHLPERVDTVFLLANPFFHNTEGQIGLLGNWVVQEGISAQA